MKRLLALVAILAIAVGLTACQPRFAPDGTPVNIHGVVPSSASGKTKAAQETGPLDPVTGLRIKEAAILAGSTNLKTFPSNKAVIGANCTALGYCTGSGTSADPFVFQNYKVIGCIQVDVSYVTIQNDYVNWQPDGAYESICHGAGATGSDGSGAAISTGNGNEVPKEHDIKILRSEIHGPESSYWNDSKIGIGASGTSLIQGNDIHGGLMAIWTGGSPQYPNVITDNYIHHVSRVHAQDAPNYLCDTNPYGTPQCVDDIHRELIWVAGVHNVAIYSNYIDMELAGVTHLGQTIECTGAIFTAHQDTWGFAPAHDIMLSNNYVDAGDGCSEINAADVNPASNYHQVYEHNVFHSGGGWDPGIPIQAGSPCNNADVNKSYKPLNVEWPTASNVYDNHDENGNLITVGGNC